MTLLMILGGLVLLGLGGELVVRGSVAAARILQVSTVVIGVVLMGFGTSLPEMVTSVQAALAGSPGISLGNVVGSNIANLLLIAGVAALLTGATVSSKLVFRDGMVMLGATIALALLIFYDGLTPLAGGALLAALAVYLTLAVAQPTGAPEGAEIDNAPLRGGIAAAIGLFAGGIVATVVGARLLVDGSVTLARAFDVPEALIGATIVAVGTSLPELAATVAAALRKQAAMAIGNVIGSNIFNIAAIVGVTALVAPLPAAAAPTLVSFDIWAMLGATVLTMIFALSSGRLSRAEGGLLLAAYAAYLAIATERSL